MSSQPGPLAALRARVAAVRAAQTLVAAPHTIAMAVEIDGAYTHGRVVGLSEAEVREVIAAWADYHRHVIWPLDWSVVRQAITARALGERWHP